MFARGSALGLVLLICFAPTASAQYQDHGYGSPAGSIRFGFLVANPVGEFRDYVDTSYGGELSGRYALDPMGVLSLRGDLGFIIYGYESKRVCMSQEVGCRINTRLRTFNNIFFGGIGPELAIPSPIARPYVHAFMGFGYFNTMSDLEDWNYEDCCTTENFGDGTMAWGVGGGLELNLSRGRVPISLDLGARYQANGMVQYLREGDIQDHADGSITLYPVVSEANLVTYRFGLTIGFGGYDPGDHEGGRGRH
jgi:hypothetical protein